MRFGRTEVSVRLDDMVICALSFGHGHKRRGFEEVSKSLDYHVSGAELGESKVKEIGNYV